LRFLEPTSFYYEMAATLDPVDFFKNLKNIFFLLSMSKKHIFEKKHNVGHCVIFSVQNWTDVLSFFLTLCRSLKNEFMSARRCVIFYLTLCRSFKRPDIVSFFLNLCRFDKLTDVVSFFSDFSSVFINDFMSV
jgi:hypothetical protein